MNFKEFLDIGTIETGINPNCSEATVRIDLKGQDRKKVNALVDKLDYEFGNSNKLENQEWDDEVKEFEWSEAYISEKTIFGVNVLEISGDAPYNFGEEIQKVIKKFLPKAKIEWAE